MPRPLIAQAHAAHLMSMKLTKAHNAVVAALAEERACLQVRLADLRDELAERRWFIACGTLAIAMDRLDRVVAEFETSAWLQKELVTS